MLLPIKYLYISSFVLQIRQILAFFSPLNEYILTDLYNRLYTVIQLIVKTFRTLFLNSLLPV